MLSYLKESLNLFNDWKKTRAKPVIQTNFYNDPGVLARTTIDIVDVENLKGKFDLTDEMIINLAGGFPTNTFTVSEFIAKSLPGDIFKTSLNFDFGVDHKGHNNLGVIERTIDLREKVIHNDLMFIQKQGSGIGTNAFINQMSAALQVDFSSIEVMAAGPDMVPPLYFPNKWDGYKTWIKFGYLLIHDHDTRYKGWSTTKSLSEDTLNKLYFQHRNYHLWENEGFTWEGVIELKKSKTSLLLFKLYLLKKNINVPLSSIVFAEVPSLLVLKTSLCTRR